MSEALAHGPIAHVGADEVLASRGRTFHWAKALLDARHAADATRLYGFCRAIDDVADEAGCADLARRRLATARHSIVCGETTDPTLADMLSLMRERGIPCEIVRELIDGVASDLEPVRMPDVDALMRYCYRVAGTVGLMMCKILDVDADAAAPHAIDLGIAMQLTNICRDVAEDAVANRRYLPATLVGDIDPRQLVVPTNAIETRARSGVAALLERADLHYASGERGLSYLPLRARGSILVAARLYRAIGGLLKRRRYAYWTRRAAISSLMKAPITARALIGGATRPSFWRAPPSHDPRLQVEIEGLPGVLSRGSARDGVRN
jgi:phytoene synthase